MSIRSQIIHEATRLFAARGYDGTSLRDIAEAVGVRKPSLLYHFSSKAELHQSVLDELLRRWNERLPRLLKVATRAERRFDGVMQETVSFFVEDADRARLLVREMLDRVDEMAEQLKLHARPWVGVVSDRIRQGQQLGEIHEDVDPEAYVLQVITLIVGGLATAKSLAGALLPVGEGGPAEPLERHTSELHRVALYSLFNAPAERRSRRTGETRGADPKRQGHGDKDTDT